MTWKEWYAKGCPTNIETKGTDMKPTTETLEQFTLERTGQAPLTFVGYLLTESKGFSEDTTRWHDLFVYRTKSGRYVVMVEYRSTWKAEIGRCEVAIFDNPKDVVRGLQNYDCTSYVAGFPPLDAYRERQDRLLKDIQSRFEDQVSEVLDMEVFEERAA